MDAGFSSTIFQNVIDIMKDDVQTKLPLQTCCFQWLGFCEQDRAFYIVVKNGAFQIRTLIIPSSSRYYVKNC